MITGSEKQQLNSQQNWDVVVIGGGAAGMMAAISVKKHHPEFSVCLLDRTFALGRKIWVCGAGRCNITNVNLAGSVDDHYYGANAKFINAVFAKFNYRDIVEFFADLGAELYVERKTDIGKMFPITNQAKTVTAILEDELERLGVEVRLQHEVSAVTRSSDFRLHVREIEKSGKVLAESDLNANYLILAAGGRTYPALGSDGSGYSLAKSLGHNIVEPVPSALPLEASDKLCHFLQGQKLDLEVTSIISGENVKTRTDEVLFTKYGLSGPAILNISREISIALNRQSPVKNGEVEVRLNFFPGKSITELEELLVSRWEKRPEQMLARSFYGIFPNKIAELIPKLAGIESDRVVRDLEQSEIKTLTEVLANYRVAITGTRGWNEAEFTAGGIDTTEVQIATLASRKTPGLYLCGEILDVDGDVGGFNLSWAWSSGWVAGRLGR